MIGLHDEAVPENGQFVAHRSGQGGLDAQFVGGADDVGVRTREDGEPGCRHRFGGITAMVEEVGDAQKNMEIVVIAQNAASLTPERAKKVAEVAKQAGIKINVVWVGGTQEDGQAIAEARSLAWLTSVTGGAFANLSGSVNPCASPT